MGLDEPPRHERVERLLALVEDRVRLVENRGGDATLQAEIVQRLRASTARTAPLALPMLILYFVAILIGTLRNAEVQAGDIVIV